MVNVGQYALHGSCGNQTFKVEDVKKIELPTQWLQDVFSVLQQLKKTSVPSIVASKRFQIFQCPAVRFQGITIFLGLQTTRGMASPKSLFEQLANPNRESPKGVIMNHDLSIPLCFLCWWVKFERRCNLRDKHLGDCYPMKLWHSTQIVIKDKWEKHKLELRLCNWKKI